MPEERREQVYVVLQMKRVKRMLKEIRRKGHSGTNH
jgi:hypothetical protein